MSDQIRAQVESIVSCASVSYSARYVTQTERDGWECDAWQVSFAYPGKPAQEFEFYTGLGLRAKVTAQQKSAARFAVPRVTENDISRRTSYGRRYLAEVEKRRTPKAPHAADVLHSLILDSSACEMSFGQWCSDFGYSDDSIKARETYDACQRNADKLRQVFTRAQIAALAEALQEY